MDRFGRVVIPKEVRDTLGIAPGTAPTVLRSGDAVVLHLPDRSPPLSDEDGVLVFTGESTEDLTGVLRKIRDDRSRGISGARR